MAGPYRPGRKNPGQCAAQSNSRHHHLAHHSKSSSSQKLRYRALKPPCSTHFQRLAPTLRALAKALSRPQCITLWRHCFRPTARFTFKGEGPWFDWHFYSPWYLCKLTAISAFNYRDTPARSADRMRRLSRSSRVECAQDPRPLARSSRVTPSARTSGQEWQRHHTAHPTSARR